MSEDQQGNGGGPAEVVSVKPGVDGRILALLERRDGRRPEELLDEIAELVGSPRRFGGGLYQKSLG